MQIKSSLQTKLGCCVTKLPLPFSKSKSIWPHKYLRLNLKNQIYTSIKQKTLLQLASKTMHIWFKKRTVSQRTQSESRSITTMSLLNVAAVEVFTN